MDKDWEDPVDNIFHEEYQYSEDSESDEDLGIEEHENSRNCECEDPGNNSEMKLGISFAQAKANYDVAGTEVKEERDCITVAGNSDLMDPDTDAILDKIVEDIKMQYKPAEFQRVAVNALGQMMNVILVSPCGSGKMNVPLLATLVLREKLKNPRGVAIVTQPLSSIMNQKIQNDVCGAAVLSMAGELTTSGTYIEDASLSCDLDDLLSGSFPVIFGHPESFDSKLGQHILRELQKLDRLILICLDEFHQGGSGHWDSFRPSMLSGSAALRLYGIKNCPSLAMTATASKSEIKEVIAALGLRKPPVLLSSSPIQSHLKYSIIKRPSNNFGLDGSINQKGERNPGLMDLLDRLILQQFLEDLEMGRKPKRCIIFSRGNGVLGAIYSRLMEMTQYRYKDCRTSPFVMNHSSLLPPTEKVLESRSSEISLYLSSNKMLLGIDLPEIDIVIFLRPYNQLAAIVQGGGRGGRRLRNGNRRRVQVYQLYNSQDFSSQNKMMSADMKRVCQSQQCTRELLRDYFVGNSQDEEIQEEGNNCCHNCDVLKLI